MQSLTIFILCHNRPDDAREAILSGLGQTDLAYSLIVSDNSSNDKVNQLVEAEFPHIKYVRRSPPLKPLEHFNTCIDEVRSNYFCLFHDDDVMTPNFVCEMKKAIHRHQNAIAIGCNAHIESFGKLGKNPSFLSFLKFEEIQSPRELAMRYFSHSQSGISPFPSYIYNRRMVDSLRFPQEGGKYSDVTWLLELSKKGNVIWINQPLLTYRLHASNDGNIESRRDRLRFLGYLKKNLMILGDGIIQDYRCGFIYKKILKNSTKMHLQRHTLATLFIKKYHWSRFTRLECYKSLLIRAFIKCVIKK